MIWQPQIKQLRGKDYILCVWRNKYVRLTPEEWVRQHFLHALLEQFHYPQSLIAVEAAIEVGEVKKRCDAIVYDHHLRPLCIIEFKAPEVTLTRKVYDQVAVYNRKVGVDFFMLSNGKEHKACHVSDTGYAMLNGIPFYEELCPKTSLN